MYYIFVSVIVILVSIVTAIFVGSLPMSSLTHGLMKLTTRSVMGSGAAKLLNKTTLVESDVDRLPVYTLTFSNPNAVDSMGVRADFGDVVKVLVPGYKPKSYSMSDSRPGEFDLTIKVYPNGRASGYLDRLQIGDEIEVFRKGKKHRQPGKRVVIIAFGVGITEGLPVAAAELTKEDAEHVHLIWAARTVADLFWTDKLTQLQEQHGRKFCHSLLLSREEREGYYYGRLNPELLESLVKNAWIGLPEIDSKEIRFLTVGTKEMMRQTEKMIQSLGYHIPKQLLLAH